MFNLLICDGANVVVSRVPVAVGAFGSSADKRGACEGWASAQPDEMREEASTTNHMRWLSTSGPVLMEVSSHMTA